MLCLPVCSWLQLPCFCFHDLSRFVFPSAVGVASVLPVEFMRVTPCFVRAVEVHTSVRQKVMLLANFEKTFSGQPRIKLASAFCAAGVGRSICNNARLPGSKLTAHTPVTLFLKDSRRKGF